MSSRPVRPRLILLGLIATALAGLFSLYADWRLRYAGDAPIESAPARQAMEDRNMTTYHMQRSHHWTYLLAAAKRGELDLTTVHLRRKYPATIDDIASPSGPGAPDSIVITALVWKGGQPSDRPDQPPTMGRGDRKRERIAALCRDRIAYHDRMMRKWRDASARPGASVPPDPLPPPVVVPEITNFSF